MATLKLDHHIAAFLDLIAASEGTSTSPVTKSDGYDIIVSGVDGHHRFDDLSTHPFSGGRTPIVVREAVSRALIEADKNGQVPAGAPREVVPALKSTASGRYQITLHTWKAICAVQPIHTFCPQDQDRAALELIYARGADQHILAGNIALAIDDLCHIWDSFPGGLFHHECWSLHWLLDTYNTLLAAQSH